MKILFLTSPGCQWSKRMRVKIRILQKEFPQHDIQEFEVGGGDIDEVAELIKVHKVSTLPALIVGDTVIEGFQLIQPLRKIFRETLPVTTEREIKE